MDISKIPMTMPTSMPVPIQFRDAGADAAAEKIFGVNSDADSDAGLFGKKITIPMPTPMPVQVIFDSDAAMPIPIKMPSALQPWE